MYCTVLYCTVLYCIVLYCTVLYCTVLYCTALYCTSYTSAQHIAPVLLACHSSTPNPYPAAWLLIFEGTLFFEPSVCHFTRHNIPVSLWHNIPVSLWPHQIGHLLFLIQIPIWYFACTYCDNDFWCAKRICAENVNNLFHCSNNFHLATFCFGYGKPSLVPEMLCVKLQYLQWMKCVSQDAGNTVTLEQVTRAQRGG
jgi:hypothetical protein